MQPKDEDEFVDMLWTMANYNSGPIAIRYPRGAGTGAKPKATPKLLEIGKAEVVQHGTRRRASSASATCSRWRRRRPRNWRRKGISVALINPRWIKPLDAGTLEFFARGVQVHLHDRGPRAAQWLRLRRDRTPARRRMINTPVVRIGWPDQFIEHGTIPILRKKHGLTSDALVEKVLPLLKKKPLEKAHSSAA